MERNEPRIVIAGMEDVLEKDLQKHQKNVLSAQEDLGAWRSARAHERMKKKHYAGLVGGGKYNDGALQRGIEQCEINIRMLSDKMKLAQEKIDHFGEIVIKLEEELRLQYEGLKALKEYRNGTLN